MTRSQCAVFLVATLVLAGCASEQGPQGEAPESSSASHTLSPEGCESGAKSTTMEQSEPVSVELGNLSFATVSPLVSRFEDALRVVVEVTNSGQESEVVELRGVDLGWASPPPEPDRRWYSQLFDLNATTQTIAAGQTGTFAWHLDMDGDLEQRGEFPLFSPTFASAGETVALTIEIVSGEVYGDPRALGLSLDGVVEGVVVDEQGDPQSNVEVDALLFSFKERLGSTKTNESGEFALCVPSAESYQERLGNRPSGYDLSTFLRVRTPNGGYGFSAVSPPRGSSEKTTITLSTPNEVDMSLVGETRFTTNHGFFWVFPLAEGFVTTEAQHPPELRKPGSVVAFTSVGQASWSVETGDECWGFDVSSTGLVAAGCHDGTVTVWNSEGQQLWQRKTQKSEAMYARLVMFSNDGTKLVAGPLDDDVELLDATSGRTLWGYSSRPDDVEPRPEILRNAVFTDDDSRIIVGYAGGFLTSLDSRTGAPEWAGGFIGEFPLVMDVDDEGNVYAVGKGREAISLSPTGEVRWRRTVYEHVSTAGINALVDGKFISHTVSGSVYALDANTGEYLWWRKIGQGDVVEGYVETGGHNALDIDPVSGLIAHTETLDARDGGGSMVTLMTPDGAVVASEYFPDLRESDGEEVGHAQRGGMAVSFNGRGHLAAVFGDGMVRVFRIS